VRHTILMPKLGLTMDAGTLVEWMVQPGASVRAGDGLFVIESEKVTVEVPAERDGVLAEVTARAGDVVGVGQAVGYLDDETEAGATPSSRAPATSVPRTPGADLAPVVPSTAPVRVHPQRIVATPLARRLAGQLNVDLGSLLGSGPRGRIRAEDVRAAAPSRSHTGPTGSTTGVSVASAAAISSAGRRVVAPTSVEAAMARRLTAAKQEIPHFYLAAEAEVSRLLDLRAELSQAPTPLKFTVGHFVVAAVARALQEMPKANRIWSDEGIVEYEGVDVGVAVNTERGLMAPVVRSIQGLPLAEISSRLQALVDRARAGALRVDDMGGGAITVSNAGMHQVTWMTPIVNPGQSMILGVGTVRGTFRPGAGDRPALRREIGLVLAADHRLIDGVSGLAFLNRVIDHLEHPVRLMMN
jgi:pyruvate dehydrogenase E2 component (dihydrolipoamide acetyltransferase)